MATITPDTGARYFSKIFGDNHGAPAFQYLWDSTVVWRNLNGQLITGGARPIVPGDLAANVSVSGLSLSVGAVNLTGVNIVTLTGNTPVSVVNTLPINVTGFINTVVTGNIGGSVTVGSVAITGQNSGSALGNLDVTHTYLPISGINTLNVIPLGGFIGITGTVNTSASVTVGAVAITGQNSGSALGNLDVTHAYLPISGAATLNVLPLGGFVGITGTVNTSASVTVGAVAITGQNSGSALGNLDVTRTYLPISGVNTINVNNLGGFIGLTGAPVVTITGVLATSTSVTVGSVAVTGGNINVTDNLGWALLSGISGTLAGNLSSAAFVTGYISGSNLGSLDVSHTYVPVSGVGSFTTSFSNTSLNVAATGVLTDQITGWNTGIKVRTEPVSFTSVSNATPSGATPFTGITTFFGQALAANPSRNELFVQNVHTGIPLYVNLGATAAGTGSFSLILNPSTVQGWAGTSYASSSYRGAVQVSGGAWIAWEA